MEAGQGPADREGATWPMKLRPNGHGVCAGPAGQVTSSSLPCLNPQGPAYPASVPSLCPHLMSGYLGTCFSYFLLLVSSAREPATEGRDNGGAVIEGRGKREAAIGGEAIQFPMLDLANQAVS